MSNGSDNDKKKFDTGVFRRLIHTEINEALGNLEMKAEAMRFNALHFDAMVADLLEMTERVAGYEAAIKNFVSRMSSYEAALADIAKLIEMTREVALRAIDERKDDQVLADIAELLERIAGVLKSLGVGNEQP